MKVLDSNSIKNKHNELLVKKLWNVMNFYTKILRLSEQKRDG